MDKLTVKSQEAIQEAQRLARACCSSGRTDENLAAIDAAWANALSLRYYLVKLIRVIAFFSEVQPLGPQETLEMAE